MRIQLARSVAVAAAFILLASTAQADEYFRKGFYLNASFAYGFNLTDTAALSTTFGNPPLPLSRKDSPGLNVRAGTQVYDWLAFELEYEWMAGLDVVQSNGVVLTTYDPDIVTVNAKFILPIWRVQPYLLVGGGLALFDIKFPAPYSSFTRSDSGFAFRGGAGLDVYITKHIAWTAEGTAVLNTSSYDFFTATLIDNLYYISVSTGLTYHF